MGRGPGRPKEQVERVSAYLTPAELERLEAVTKQTGMSDGAIRRKAFLVGLAWAERELVPVMTAAEKDPGTP